jgi:hypothetical protein
MFTKTSFLNKLPMVGLGPRLLVPIQPTQVFESVPSILVTYKSTEFEHFQPATEYFFATFFSIVPVESDSLSRTEIQILRATTASACPSNF